MLRHIPTGQTFETRKDAIKLLGRRRYTIISKRNEWEFLNKD